MTSTWTQTNPPLLLIAAVAAAAGCGEAPLDEAGALEAPLGEASGALAAGCEAGPAEPAGTKIGVVTGQIYRAYGDGRPAWTLGQTSVINDIRARLGAGWVRIEIRPTCSGAVHDGCEPAGTYEALIPALKGCGLRVLGLLDRPSESVGNPDPRASEEAVDAWIQGAYLPRVTEIVNAYGLDALEVMNEPNNDKLSPSSFALVVKRTYEHVRNVMGRASPAIISGGVLNLYTGENYYAPLARSRAFSDYRNAYGRWPLDGFGIHPYQNHTWTGHIGDLRGFLLGEMANVRSVLGELRDVPFWVTEFGWQNTCDCAGDALEDGYCGCPQESGACGDQVARYMTSAFSAFRDPSANVAAAFWYDYRDDEADRASDGASCRSPVGERFGLRKRQPEGYEAKPAWSAFQRIAGGSGGPTAPPAAGEPVGVGIFRAPGTWVLDRNRNGWDGDAGIRFSAAGDTPVVGDWNGDGRSEPGVFRNADGMWLLDVDGNGWSPGADRQLQFGLSGDVPVVGDWTGTGQTRVGIFRAGAWILDLDGDGYDPSDRVVHWGAPGDTPVVGSWDGSGQTREGVVRVLPDGMMYWYLDMNGNGQDGADRALQFGLRGDVPLVGDWNGTGQTRVGVFRNGEFFLDLNGNGYDGELPLRLGQAGDKPVVGRWSGTARSLVGAWRPSTGMWFLDMNGNGWDGADRALQFGLTGDVPVTGAW